MDPDFEQEVTLPVARTRAPRSVRLGARVRHWLRRARAAVGRVQLGYVVTIVAVAAFLTPLAYVVHTCASGLAIR